MSGAKDGGILGRTIEFLESSIGKKMMVALAGLLLCGFLVAHLAGNLLLFVGVKEFNAYGAAIEHNPLLPVAEAGLVILFLIHILLSLRARWANWKARPAGYEQFRSKGARSPGSRTIAISGIVILAFLIVHVKTFRLAPHALREADLFALVTGAFKDPLYAGFYVLAMAALGLHLSHGVQSAFQTFGVNHPRYTPLIRRAGIVFAFAIAAGFAAIPLYFGFLRGMK